MSAPEARPASDAGRPLALVRAFVLHRRDYSNTSLLVEVFASGHGRFPAIARGARRPRNPAGALLQPFQPLWLGLAGRGEVRTLTRVEAAGRPFPLAGLALPCGFYVNELLMRLLARNDPHEPLFAFYHAVLAGLAEGAARAGRLGGPLRQFELRLLEELGYAPCLDREGEGGAPVTGERRYLLDPGQPLRPAAPGEPGAVSGATLLALAAGAELDATAQREARDLLRCLLEPHLGPRPLKSRELLRRRHLDHGHDRPPAPPTDPEPMSLGP